MPTYLQDGRQNTIGFNILLWWKMALWMNFLGEKTPLPSSTFIKWIGWILWAHWTCLIWLILTQVRLAKSPVGRQITGTGLPEPDREKCRIIPVTGTGIPVEHSITDENLSLLGAPIFKEGRRNSVRKAKNQVENICERIRFLDALTALFILCNYTLAPRFTCSKTRTPCKPWITWYV